jgi:hypothetical protein
MAQKIIIDPTDFAKIIDFFRNNPVSFAMIEQAAEIKIILRKAQVINFETKENIPKELKTN